MREVDEGPPVGVRYQLAEPGKALMPVLDQLMDLGPQQPLTAGVRVRRRCAGGTAR